MYYILQFGAEKEDYTGFKSINDIKSINDQLEEKQPHESSPVSDPASNQSIQHKREEKDQTYNPGV